MATSTKKRTTTTKTATSGTPSQTRAKPDLAKQTKTGPTDIVEPTETINTPDPVIVEPNAIAEDLPMRKKELIDLVVERSGIKKKDAKPVVEAMLAVLGETVGAGRELNLQPLGKLRINRSEERSNGRIIVCKLRQSLATITNLDESENSVPSPLAEDES